MSAPVTATERAALDRFRAAHEAGFTVADLLRMLTCLRSTDQTQRRAALCKWLASEERPEMRRGLLAGLAAMEVA